MRPLFSPLPAVATPALLVASHPAPAAAAPVTPLINTLPLANQVVVTVTTGADGLLAGNNADVVVGLNDGTIPGFRQSINNGGALAPGSTKTVTIPLGRHVVRTEISTVMIQLPQPATDSWDVSAVTADAKSKFDTGRIASASGTPFRRLTPSSALTRNVDVPKTSTHWPVARPTTKDLRQYQTEYKSQGSRYSCIIFSPTAAIEAAYKRGGYGDLDLSEEFFNWQAKQMSLPFALQPNADMNEGQPGVYAGGQGRDSLLTANDGLRIPLESDMAYKTTEYTEADDPLLANKWDSAVWRIQRNVSDINLGRLFPNSARNASTFYGVYADKMLSTSVAEIESLLASNREVVININSPAHSVLIVGYNRTNPAAPFFYIKDSGGLWSQDQQVPYSNVTSRTIATGGFVQSLRTPGPWTEMGLVGRWNLSFDGWHGVLDITRVPGVMNWYTGAEARLGNFYDSTGKAFRVNGSITGNGISFYIDGADPNLPYNKLTGRHFVYYRMRTASGKEILSGYHTDPGSSIQSAGFARKDAPVDGSIALAAPLRTQSYMGRTFAATWFGVEGTLRLENRVVNGSTIDLIHGTFQSGTVTKAVDFIVDHANPGKVMVQEPSLVNRVTVRKLTWEPGILAVQNLVLVAIA